MFGIDGSEFLVILVVLIVVVGPRDLPKMLHAFGKATARMRATAQEFRQHFDEAMREAEMDGLHDALNEMKQLDPRRKLTEVFDPIRSATQDLQARVHDIAPKLETEARPEIKAKNGQTDCGDNRKGTGA